MEIDMEGVAGAYFSMMKFPFMLGLGVACRVLFLIFKQVSDGGGKMALYIWLSLITSRYFICFSGFWRRAISGGFFCLSTLTISGPQFLPS